MIYVCIYCSLVCCTTRVHNIELCTYNIVLLLHFDNKHHLLCFIAFASFCVLFMRKQDLYPVDYGLLLFFCFFLNAHPEGTQLLEGTSFKRWFYLEGYCHGCNEEPCEGLTSPDAGAAPSPPPSPLLPPLQLQACLDLCAASDSEGLGVCCCRCGLWVRIAAVALSHTLHATLDGALFSGTD